MFNRVGYKKMAKEQLKGRWKIPVLSTLLAGFLLLVFSGALAVAFSDEVHADFSFGRGAFNFGIQVPDETKPFSFLICFVMTAFLLAQKRLFEKMSKSADSVFFSDFVDGLGQWWQAVRGLVWQCIWVWLWSLLFLIPGIVKWYSYSMMFYIMAEYPKIGVCKAMRISKELTRGYKGDLFVTDITFIPLFVLSLASVGIGFLWLVPYYQATHTNIYQALKQFALDSKRVLMEDFV